jgi:hypothetical protein
MLSNLKFFKYSVGYLLRADEKMIKTLVKEFGFCLYNGRQHQNSVKHSGI